MTLLNREALLKKTELKVEKVDLGNKDFVYVREMTAGERDAYEVSLLVKGGEAERDMTDFRAKLAVRVLCDEKGKLILKIEDYKTLSQNFAGNKMRLIAEAADKLNKVSASEQEKLVKN